MKPGDLVTISFHTQHGGPGDFWMTVETVSDALDKTQFPPGTWWKAINMETGLTKFVNEKFLIPLGER